MVSRAGRSESLAPSLASFLIKESRLVSICSIAMKYPYECSVSYLLQHNSLTMLGWFRLAKTLASANHSSSCTSYSFFAQGMSRQCVLQTSPLRKSVSPSGPFPSGHRLKVRTSKFSSVVDCWRTELSLPNKYFPRCWVRMLADESPTRSLSLSERAIWSLRTSSVVGGSDVDD